MIWALSLLLLCGGGPQDVAPDPGPAPSPLLDHKRELMGDPRPFVHLTPDAILVYFKHVDLKRIPVEELGDSPRATLRRSRVRTWIPPPSRPTLLADDTSIDDVDPFELTLRVDDMPETFVAWLEDGTLLAFTPNPAHRSAVEVLRRLQRDDPTLAETSSESWDRSLLVRLEAASAREFYWLLQEGTGVIY
jgi:hypothetical protein